MMELEISIDLDNDAFEDDPTQEAARILLEFAQKLRDGAVLVSNDACSLQDVNGNRVGRAVITKW